MNPIEIKKKLIEFAKSEVEKKINFLKNAINNAQKESASHKGRMESRYDTFKEEAQAAVNSYRKQLFEMRQLLFFINEIPLEITDKIELGSIIETNENNYFISVGILDSIDINGKKYLLISPESPIGQIFLGKKSGDEFEFRGRKIKIKNVK